jgi:hypothetical protein
MIQAPGVHPKGKHLNNENNRRGCNGKGQTLYFM